MAIDRRAFHSRAALRLMLAAGAAALLAGCSDATRFTDPFSDPFQGSSSSVDRAPTGAIAKPGADSRAIQIHPLAAPGSANGTPVASQTQAPAGGKVGSTNHWSAEGGTPVVVARGETAGLIATRYGVPAEALLRVNGFSSAGEVRPGSRLVIPVYRATVVKSADASARKAEALKPAKNLDAKSRSAKTAKSDDDKATDKYGRKTADENAKLIKAKGKLAQAETAQKAPKTKVEQAKQGADTPPHQSEKRERSNVAAAEAPVARKADRTPVGSIPSQPEEKSTASDAAHPEFRWPARGRIIRGFNSGGNDGINISVPEGTQVKAAEGGVVAYAGSELKGYGNLVLIRHPNGFVTAYAHNGELDVKRGDQVKRGQTIAKSGQSGNVASPQLHFELRKGSTPVDPTAYLAGL